MSFSIITDLFNFFNLKIFDKLEINVIIVIESSVILMTTIYLIRLSKPLKVNNTF